MAYDIEKNFKFHTPKGEQNGSYKELREKFKYLASVILDLTPTSREQSLALTHLEESLFWSNASIARKDEEST